MAIVRSVTRIALVALAICGLAGCSSAAPHAPLGWHRQAANPAPVSGDQPPDPSTGASPAVDGRNINFESKR